MAVAVREALASAPRAAGWLRTSIAPLRRASREGYAPSADEQRRLAMLGSGAIAATAILVHLPGTPNGTLSPLLDSIVQEVDVRTGLVVWEWHSYGHIPLESSQATPQNSATFDAFHINAIQALRKHRVLISARDTSAVYNVDRASG